MTHAEFVARFERPRLPCVITNLTDAWPAATGSGGDNGSSGGGSGGGSGSGAGGAWAPAELLRRFGRHRFKVGADDDGYAVRMRFEHFLRYASDAAHSQV